MCTCMCAGERTRGVIRENDADSGVTLGLTVFFSVDEGDDLVPPSPPMMAHLLSLGTQSKDAAQALKTERHISGCVRLSVRCH